MFIQVGRLLAVAAVLAHVEGAAHGAEAARLDRLLEHPDVQRAPRQADWLLDGEGAVSVAWPAALLHDDLVERHQVVVPVLARHRLALIVRRGGALVLARGEH